MYSTSKQRLTGNVTRPMNYDLILYVSDCLVSNYGVIDGKLDDINYQQQDKPTELYWVEPYDFRLPHPLHH